MATAWQPIETAPKDGTIIDLYFDESGRWTGCFWGKPTHSCGEAGQYCDSDWHRIEDGWVWSTFNQVIGEEIPSYWMLVPNPPSVEGC